MYIESIKLFNFRNFKHNLIVENFSPGINILVGPNGSGKSSFFEAFKLLTSKKLFDLKHELSNEQISSEPKRLKNYLLIQLSFNNSKKIFPVKKRKIIFRRLINEKTDKLWISKYDSDTLKVYEFLYSNGIDLKAFFLFLDSKIQLDFKISNSCEKLKFFKKKSNFILFSKYQTKIVFLFKKIIIIKKKLSNLLKLLVKEQKRMNKQKKVDNAKQKMNLTLLLLEKLFSRFKKSYFKELQIRISLKCSNILLKIIDSKTKLKILVENISQLKSIISSKEEFIRNIFKISFFRNNFNSNILNIKGKIFFDNIEKHLPFSKSLLSNFKWNKSILNYFKNLNFNVLYLHPKYHNFTQIYNKYKLGKEILTLITFKKKLLENYQQRILFFDTYFGNYLSEKRNGLFLESYFGFYRDIFLVKQKIQRILDKFSYELNFVGKIINNQETNLSKSLGPNITKSIRFISQISREKNCYFNKIKGILLDLLAVYRYFEKPFEAFFWPFLPNLIITDKNVIKLITNDFIFHKKTRLDFILSNNFKKKKFTNPIHTNLLSFNSFIYSNENFIPIIEDLTDNLFLCTKSNLAAKLSKKFLVTTITMEGQIFYSNGIISKHFLNSDFSIVHKTVILKRERNFLNWITSHIKEFKCLDFELKKIIAKKKKNEIIGLEIKKIFFLKKETLFSPKNSSNEMFTMFSKKNLIKYLKKLNTKKKMPFNLNAKILNFPFRKFKLIKKEVRELKKIETQEYLKKKNRFNFLTNVKKNPSGFFENKSIYIKNLDINVFSNINSNFKFKQKTAFFDHFFIENSNFLNLFYIQNHYYHFLVKKITNLVNRLCLNRKNLFYPVHFDKRQIIYLKKNLFYLSEVPKKIKFFLSPLNFLLKKKFNLYIFDLVNFYENIETNFKILFQVFEILEVENGKKFQKMSKEFSFNFQKNLNLIFTKAKSCLIWKEKRIEKVFRDEILYKNLCSGLKILIQLDTNDVFNSIENLSKGQFALSILIFYVTLCLITNKMVFFFDEIDKNMDFFSQKLSSKLIKKTSSRGLQFFIITHQKRVSRSGDKWYGISSSEKGCLVENISILDSKKFLTSKH
jgi:predicted ATPase